MGEMQGYSQNTQIKGLGTLEKVIAESLLDFPKIMESLLKQSNLWEYSTYNPEMASYYGKLVYKFYPYSLGLEVSRMGYQK